MKVAPQVPAPTRWPLGHTAAFAKDTRGFIASCMDAGLDVARARIAFRNFYFLLHPEAIRHVLQKHHRNYVKSFAYDGLKPFLGNGLLTAEGDSWLRHRRMMQPAFHRKQLAELAVTMEKAVTDWLETIPRNETRNLQQDLLRLTQEVTTRALFSVGSLEIPGGGELGDSLLVLRQYANDRLKNPMMAPLWVPGKYNRRFKSAMQALREMVMGIIRERKKAERKPDLLQMLLDARDEHSGEGMSDEQIYDEIATLFVAGQETTTQALTFLFYELNKAPAYLDQIRQEIQSTSHHSTTGDKGSLIDNCLQEALRLYPPAWAMSRRTLKEDVIMGYRIPAGSIVFLSIYAMHRSRQWWESPNDFKPERFEELTNASLAYLPFGQGPRKCIGDQFALWEMRIALKKMLSAGTPVLEAPDPLPLITPMTLSPGVSIHYRLVP